ncbi:hypothetical protein L1987_85454 [Smallanthus sonchifolius]|uniref:Uncharacterized protein n=1 Tax=Smallanthus sonchifolius TaxID=185202 RepID=A0ACB8XXA4_9ASTR|nr:hypothetical protein L1987_85454 [Smallanthus sonchifolius]
MGQRSLIYSFVARGTVILSEYTEFTGNFTSIAAQCFQKLPATNNKLTSGLYDMKGAKGKGAAKRDALKHVGDRKVGKKKAPAKAASKGKTKAAKDPNMPERPSSASFVFLEEFRKTFKKENPNVKAVSAAGEVGGEKWNSMSAAENYEAKAAKRKTEYEKLMKA